MVLSSDIIRKDNFINNMVIFYLLYFTWKKLLGSLSTSVSMIYLYFAFFVGLLRQPVCFFAFLFLGDGLDPCLLYSVTNVHP